MNALVSVGVHGNRALRVVDHAMKERRRASGQGLDVGAQHMGCLKAVFYVSMVWAVSAFC